VRDVVDEASEAIRREADDRTRQAGSALHELSHDLHEMAKGGDQHTNAGEYLDAIASAVDRVADRLDDGTQGIVGSLRSTAERRPGSYVLGSALAGFAMGRLIRNGDRPDMGGNGHQDVRSAPSTASSQSDEVVDLRNPAATSPIPAPADQYARAGAASNPSEGAIPPPPPPGSGPERF
jgi:hypothetical protein